MAAKRALSSLARQTQTLDHELAALLSDLDALTQTACPGVRQSHGIGVDRASILLAAAGRKPERLRSGASFAGLCGTSPLPASSGNTRRHRLNRGGNRQANAALHRIPVVRLRYYQAARVYAERSRAEGLSSRETLRCLKRFMAREVFHLLRGRPPLRTAAASTENHVNPRLPPRCLTARQSGRAPWRLCVAHATSSTQQKAVGRA
jgi:transposase